MRRGGRHLAGRGPFRADRARRHRVYRRWPAPDRGRSRAALSQRLRSPPERLTEPGARLPGGRDAQGRPPGAGPGRAHLSPPQDGRARHGGRAPMSFPEIVAFIAACMALNALGIDTMLPALAEIANELGVVEENHRQAVIVVYLLAFGASQVVYGPLSDRYGRRPVLLGGLAVFVLGSIAAMLAGSFATLLLARALQGLGAGGPRVVAVAIARDRFEGPMLGQVMSLAMMVLMIVPVLAPSIGQWILLVAAWRWIFSALLGFGLALEQWTVWRLPQTLSPARRRRISVAAVLGGYREFLTCRDSLVHTLGMVLIMSFLFAFVMSSQQVLVDLYGVGTVFPLLIALVAGVMAIGAFVNARLVM